MSIMGFCGAHPKAAAQETINRWLAESEAEKVVTEHERRVFNRYRRSRRDSTMRKVRDDITSNADLIAQARDALDEAMKRNGFTERFHISIKGDR